jgi:hypothetical protein
MRRKKETLPTRGFEDLISDFENSKGEFEEFHNGLNGEEKIMFKQYLEEMRKK